MYKKVKEYAKKNGLTVDEKNGLAYGKMNGYFVLIRQDPVTLARHTVHLWVKPGETQPIPEVSDFLGQCKTKFKYLQAASYTGSKITAEFQGLGFSWGKNYMPCLEGFLSELTVYCRDNSLIQCCEKCGTEYGLSLYELEDSCHLTCSPCYAEMTGNVQKSVNREKARGNGNLIGGIVGALLGSLIGVAVWVLVYQLGYISAIAGAIMVICALKGYELLGGRLSTAGIIISCIISLIMVLVSEQVSLGIEIYNAYKEYYEITFFDAFRSVPAFLEEPELLTSVISDIVFGYVLMALGAWGTIRQALKKSRGKVETALIASVTGADGVNGF